VQIAERLKAGRQRHGLSLRALAERTGFSASFLSQVELGQTTPSLGSLQKIAEALDLSMASLVAPAVERTTVLRKSEREVVHSEWSKASAEWLVPHGFDDRLDASLIEIDPRGRTGTTRCASGRRLFAYCLRGAATLTFTDERESVRVDAGDSVVLDGPLSFSWENHGEARSDVLVVVVRIA
jgi:transcriptional regulator with XRE-family HTH domain